MSGKIPVTVLTGYLGAGKTTLLNRILSEPHGKKYAVIVNEFGEIGIDNDLVVGADEEVFEMNNGCICCTVRGDLIRIIDGLMKRKGTFDAIIVETTGLADPAPVAQTFFMDQDVGERARLDAVVTVADAKHLTERLKDAPEAKNQIAFADVIILNKTDLVTAAELGVVEAICRQLNPLARIVHAIRGEVPLGQILDTGLFDMERAQSAPGWRQALEFGKTPETEEYGVSSFVYRARRPFHPTRLKQVLDSEWPGVWRSKGFFWLASRMNLVGSWSQAGAASTHEWGGYWWAAFPPERRPQDPESRAFLSKVWAAPHGDRRQEIVLIGKDMDQAALTALLNTALLTPEEYRRGPKAWARLADPFPKWGTGAQAA